MQHVKNIVKKILYYGGYYHLLFRLKKPSHNRLLILMFHDLVEDRIHQSDWTQRGKPNRSQFTAQIKYLVKHYHVVTVEEAVEELGRTGIFPERAVAITFDDGYASTYSIAFPVLQRYGIAATVYLPTDWINGRMTPWWLSLKALIRALNLEVTTVAELEELLPIQLSRNERTLGKGNLTKANILSALEDYLRNKDEKTISGVLDSLQDVILKGKPKPSIPEAPLSWDQVREMSSYGIKFGAHTCSHLNLSHSDDAIAEQEIVKSKLEIENQISSQVMGFAYPYGTDLARYDMLALILRKHGFTYACTGISGNNYHTTDSYLLRRITLPLTTSSALIGRVLCIEYLAGDT